MFEGGCECGRIRYRVTGEILELSHCHCGMCRRLHGAAYGTYAGVGSADFALLEGEDSLAVYRSSPGVERRFCAVCGSTLLALFDVDPDRVYLTMGTVDGNPPHPEPFHIFTSSKAPWHEITDDFPQYGEWRNGP